MVSRVMTVTMLGGGLVLAACGGTSDPAVETVTETVTVTAEAAPTATAEPQPTEVETETPDPSVDTVETATTEPTSTGEPPVAVVEPTADEPQDPRDDGQALLDLVSQGGVDGDTLDTGQTAVNGYGHLMKDVGQWAATQYGDVVTSVFRVTDIEAGYQCPSPTAESPVNGQFIAVTLEVAAAPELANEDVSSLWFSAYDFEVWDREGTVESDSIGNQQFCLDAANALPATIEPGQNARGKIVLDTSMDTGLLVLRGDFLGFYDSGWVWEF